MKQIKHDCRHCNWQYGEGRSELVCNRCLDTIPGQLTLIAEMKKVCCGIECDDPVIRHEDDKLRQRHRAWRELAATTDFVVDGQHRCDDEDEIRDRFDFAARNSDALEAYLKGGVLVIDEVDATTKPCKHPEGKVVIERDRLRCTQCRELLFVDDDSLDGFKTVAECTHKHAFVVSDDHPMAAGETYCPDCMEVI